MFAARLCAINPADLEDCTLAPGPSLFLCLDDLRPNYSLVPLGRVHACACLSMTGLFIFVALHPFFMTGEALSFHLLAVGPWSQAFF